MLPWLMPDSVTALLNTRQWPALAAATATGVLTTGRQETGPLTRATPASELRGNGARQRRQQDRDGQPTGRNRLVL